MKKIKYMIAVVSIILLIAGCAGMSETQQRTVSGGAIGAGAGALTGYIIGESNK